ncbi:glycoside hydrolase family 3 N-terminal domain-containing protein [Ruminococcus sp.]|uniref:glycoside hydrolase family 3 protein n=1 Tax=Ruminococcus sp. TaxID=41978 RepID=UPI0025F64108|nr:glycoside hydrolase family 3 N-terminal domain-containing protein [Ruminococcus sp.]MBQ8966257.1 glycoside hydrolase family 3 [Ruminococcus sp.]
MAKKKKAKAKGRLILRLFVLLLITGALSGVAINGYFKNRPKEAETAENSAVKKTASSEKESVSEKETAESAAEDTSEEKSGSESTAELTVAEPADEKKTESKAEKSAAPTSGDEEINKLLEGMSLHEKVCQMFIVTPESLTGYDVVTQSGEATKESLENYPVGGLIYFAQNLEDIEQTKAMISNVQQYSEDITGMQLFISVDEEGGTVARCADTLGTTEFDSMYNYRAEGTDTAYDNAYTIAQDISGLGFNLDFAPVADTWSNPDNTVIGRRAYSDDFKETAELVASAVKGFRDGGVACTVKHFPGHGDTAEDSHLGMATSGKTIEELEKEEYLAFESGIAAGADMVMVGHITMVNVDNMPASLSKTFITDELRNKLGFKGLIVTDALGMGALANYYSSDEIAVEVIKAGGDILLMPEDLESAVKGIENAIESGDITEDRINESVIRILELKKERGML